VHPLRHMRPGCAAGGVTSREYRTRPSFLDVGQMPFVQEAPPTGKRLSATQLEVLHRRRQRPCKEHLARQTTTDSLEQQTL
jgi:hypothetical protein